MTAIISTTYDDQYLFYLPITTWAWNRLGVNVKCFMPRSGYFSTKYEHVYNTMHTYKMKCHGILFDSPENKQATYAQCARLYAAALPLFDDNEILITSDIDMAVFNKEDFLGAINPELITIIGADLVPEGQFPMCYIAMTAEKWRRAMNIQLGESPQDKLDQLLGHIDCENFRGNYWAKDQEEAYNHITQSGQAYYKATRSNDITQFATRRADRDGWPSFIYPPHYIDAHLPRPGYTAENFAKILNLFQSMYPLEDFTWMQEYRDQYVKLI